MNLFANMFNHQQIVNPMAMILQRFEQMKNSGQISQAQYDDLMKNRNNPHAMAVQRFEQMKNSGQISQEQYDALMQNQNDPQRMISTMLQSNMISNEQYSSARERVQSFFGSK